MIRIIVLVVALCLPAVSFADVEKRYHISEAQKQVDDYRALRRACSITRGEQRRHCFSRLSEATDSYIKAKNLLKMYDDAAPLVGQVNVER